MHSLSAELNSRVQSELLTIEPERFAKGQRASVEYKRCDPLAYRDFIRKVGALIQTVKVL